MSAEENIFHEITRSETKQTLRLSVLRAALASLRVTSWINSFLLLADLSDRTHVLLLVATVAVYTILALGLLALGSHVTRNTLRVLKAIELLKDN